MPASIAYSGSYQRWACRLAALCVVTLLVTFDVIMRPFQPISFATREKPIVSACEVEPHYTKSFGPISLFMNDKPL